MRSSTFLTAAFAATALSTPLGKRDLEIETVYDVVYVTDIVTETAGASSAAATTAASSVSSLKHWAHHHHSSRSSSAAAAPASSSTAVAVSSSYVAPSSSYVAPSSSYVAPSSTQEATSVYVAPSSTEAANTEVATSYAASSSSSSAQASATGTSSTYQDAVIQHHNYHRANHSATDLVWDTTLASTAAEIAANCIYQHNVTAGGGGYGQNIAAGLNAGSVSIVISDLFYNGEVNYFSGLYGQASPSMSNFENWGHFSQIVWKGTTKVGCATQDCTASGLALTGDNVPAYFTVCNYGTPGNYAGEYATNVGASLGKATVAGSNTST